MSDIDLLLAEVRSELHRRQRSRDQEGRLRPEEWFNLISDSMQRAVEGEDNPDRFRANMLKAAGLVLAAVLACDRKHLREKVAGSAVKMGP